MTSDASSSLSPEQAAHALADVQSGREAAARRLPTPWWYHPLFGLVLATLVGSFGLPQPARSIVLGVAIAAELAMFWLYRRLTGVWIDASKIEGLKGPTWAACGVTVGLLVLALALESLEVTGGAFAVGVVLGVAYVLYWRWVERSLVRSWHEAP